MKPEEAKQKWCPFVLFEDGEGKAHNRSWFHPIEAEQFCCIAERCMMWRTRYEDGEEHGYCGLAR